MAPKNMRRWGWASVSVGTAVALPSTIIQFAGLAVIPDPVHALSSMLILGGWLAILTARRNERAEG